MTMVAASSNATETGSVRSRCGALDYLALRLPTLRASVLQLLCAMVMRRRCSGADLRSGLAACVSPRLSFQPDVTSPLSRGEFSSSNSDNYQPWPHVRYALHRYESEHKLRPPQRNSVTLLNTPKRSTLKP